MFEREPITAGELMDKQFLPKPVIVEGMLPAGTYILAGTPKIGKSFLMTQLCWSVAEGIPFLGLATRKSTVLYLALEDTQERLQSRLARMFGTDWSGSEFHLLFQINQQGDALIQQFQDFILEHPDTRLIVIDTLQRVRESNGSPYSYSHDYETIVPLKTFADAYRHLRHWKVVIQIANDQVPLWEKANLSLEEAAAYFGIGINKLRDMTNDENCPFVLWNGSKRLIKRKAFERYLDSAYSI